MDRTTLLPLAAFFVAALALALGRRTYLPGRGWSLFRALFPSWRFFEEPVHLPRLHCQAICTADGMPDGPWLPCLGAPARKGAATLLFNPEASLHMACQSLLEQLVSDLEEEVSAEEFARSPSYALVRNLARQEARKRGAVGPKSRFRFKVSLGEEDVLVSQEHEVTDADH